jgi:hypothetical protein
LLRPSYRNRTPRPGEHLLKSIRQLIESVNDTLKGQLDLELHGGRSIDGLGARIAQRILALTAARARERAAGGLPHRDRRPDDAQPEHEAVRGGGVPYIAVEHGETAAASDAAGGRRPACPAGTAPRRPGAGVARGRRARRRAHRQDRSTNQANVVTDQQHLTAPATIEDKGTYVAGHYIAFCQSHGIGYENRRLEVVGIGHQRL